MAEGCSSSDYDKKIAAIARDEDDSRDEVKTTKEPNDDDFFGFGNLEGFVYRVCSPRENISDGIFCKDPNSNRTINQHVASGSKNPSKYISTTASHDVALLWAYYEMDTEDRTPRKKTLPVVKIRLKVLEDTYVEDGCANLTDKKVREHFVRGDMHRNFAEASKEVIFTDHIPRTMPHSESPISSAAMRQGQSFTREGLNADELVQSLKNMTLAHIKDPQLVYWPDDNKFKPEQPKKGKKRKKKDERITIYDRLKKSE